MRLTGLVYRAHNPQWAWSPLSGDGAKRYGGRFNRPGLEALYTSLSPLTAIREASPLGRPMQPLTLCAYEVDATPMFDATDMVERARQGVDEMALRCPNWERYMLEGRIPASQALAGQLIEAGFVGMKVPSFARMADASDINVVFWQWGAQAPCSVRLIDDDNRLGPVAGS